MKKFLVLFLTPLSVLDSWMATDETTRKSEEERLQAKWASWMENNKAAILDMPSGAGKTKVVSQDGVQDGRNTIMMYATVQADSREAAAALFVKHPHLEIPESTIEVMEVTPMK